MTEKVAKYTSESDDESENKPKFQSPEKLKDGNSQATLTTTVSAESDEYDTASEESGSGDYSDESETEGGEEHEENEDGSVILDVERQSGDGQENDGENKKKVDDDEDRSNPQYIPKKGTFYEHDDRTAEDMDADVETIDEGETSEEPAIKTKEKEQKEVKPTRKWQASQDRWTHDRFEENEQAPKSRTELVSAYGYDIRSEDGPPKARRRRRYGKGPNKYTRNWEDEAAYTKQTQPRKPRPEDFPPLGSEKRQSKTSRHRNSDRQSSEYKENNDRNVERNEDRRSHGGRDDRDNRGENNRDQRRGYKDNKAGSSSSNNNNRRSQNNQKNTNNRNENYRSGQNTLEFINQNRNKGSESQKEPLSHRFTAQQQQSQQQNSNYHSQMHNVPPQQQGQGHYHQTNNSMSNDTIQKEAMSFANSRISNQRYQNENIDENRYHQQQQQQQHMQGKDQRDTRQTTPVSQNQQQVMQQPTQQQLQNYVQIQQQKVQQQMQQMSQVQGVQNQGPAGDASRTKRYSSLRQRTGMENVPQNQAVPVQQNQPNQQQMIQEQNMMSEAAMLQQIQQNEKLKQIQSTMAHQKQISYHQAITPQAPPQQPPQANQALPLQNTNAAQYPPQAYYAQTGPEYPQAGVQQPTPVQTQQPQLITAAPQSASAQYAQYAPQNAPSYIQNAYLPQQPGPVTAQPPPQIYVPSIQQSAPQTQFQPQYSGYTPNFTPQPTNNQSAPIYQSQPPPSITYFTPTATNPPPARVTRRPTNAIPILAPPERAGNGNSKRNEYETGDKITTSDAKQMQQASQVGSAENIDHILDNMFVRRPPLQPTQMIKSASPSIDVAVADSVKNLSLKDDTKDDKQQLTTSTTEKVG